MPMIDVYAATCTFSDKHTPAHDLAARDAPIKDTLIRPTQPERHPTLVRRSKDAALLVIGSRGRGASVGMLIGSVSQYCVTHAHCPVVVLRGPEG